MPTGVNPSFSSASSRPVPAVICEVSDSSDDLDGSGPDDVSLIDSVAFHSWKKSLTTQYRAWMPSRAKDASTTIGNAFFLIVTLTVTLW